MFDSGANVVIQGPARLSVEGRNTCFLEEGRLVARVNSSAIGFTVRTSRATIIDLGTEFGVVASETDEMLVSVYEGVVQFVSHPSGGNGSSRTIQLQAGEAVAVDSAGNVKDKPVAPEARLVRRMPTLNGIPNKNITIVAASPGFPGEFRPANLIDGKLDTEYASHNAGAGTFVTFDMGRNVMLAGIEHVERQDPARVVTSRLEFSLAADFSNVVAVKEMNHAAIQGKTLFRFTPIVARYVRWTVTSPSDPSLSALGGAEMQFLELREPETTSTKQAETKERTLRLVA